MDEQENPSPEQLERLRQELAIDREEREMHREEGEMERRLEDLEQHEQEAEREIEDEWRRERWGHEPETPRSWPAAKRQPGRPRRRRPNTGRRD